jgi:hypothetical protein
MVRRWLKTLQRHQSEVFRLVALFVLALGLRVWGIDYGLPYSQLPDESGDIATALQIVRGEQPEYAYHRVGWSMAQIPVHGLHYVGLMLTRPGFTLDQFEAHYYVERDDFILVTRLYLAMLTSLIPLIVYWLGKQITLDWRGGMLPALLMAVHPAHVYLSHVALPDAFATLWVAVALLAAVIIAQTGNRWAYVVGGGAAALAMLARLQTVMIVVPLALAHIWVWHSTAPKAWRFFFMRWLWALLGFVVLSLVFNPFILLTPQAVIADIQFIFGERYTGVNNWQPELQQASPLLSITQNLYLPITFIRPYLFLAALFSAGWALYRRSMPMLIVAAFGGIFTLSLLPAPGPRITFWLPATIPACIVAGYGLYGVWQAARGWIRTGITLGMIALVSMAFYESITIDRVLAAPSTLTLAYTYITEHLPAGTRLMQADAFIYSVPLARTSESMERLAQMETLPAAYAFFLANPALNRQPNYDVYGAEYARSINSDADMRAFMREQQIEYVIETEYCQGSIAYPMATGLTYPIITEAIRAELELVYNVSPFGEDTCQQPIENRTHMEYMRLQGWERAGPIIRIYRVSASDQ